MALDLRKNRSALETRRLVAYSLRSVAIVVLAAGLFLAILSAVSLVSSRADVPVEKIALGPDGNTPALRFEARPLGGAAEVAAAPSGGLGTVIVVHGFSGSKEFMRNISYSLARSGFEVYAVDLPGHGQSPLRLDSAALTDWFSALLADMKTKGQFTPGGLYLLGHSLGTLVVTRGALENPGLGIRGVVALSPIFSDINLTQPANYLALFGESELSGVGEAALKALSAGTGLETPALETTYGDMAAGTARAAAVIKGASHISIVDSSLAIGSSIIWLRSATGVPATELPRLQREKAERSFGAIGVLLVLLGAFYLGAGAVGLLGHAPRRPDTMTIVEDARVAAGLPVKTTAAETGPKAPPLPERIREARAQAVRLFAVTRVIPILYALAAVVAAVFVGFVGTLPFIRQAGTDYLSVYLLVFALVAGPLVLLATRLLRSGPLVNPRIRLGGPLSVALGLVLFLMVLGALGWFETLAWVRLWPAASRWPLILLLAVLFFPFSAVDEMVRGTVHDRAGLTWGLFVAVIGKLMLVVTWFASVFLPHPPQALIVVAPVMIGLLVLLDLVGSMLYNEHGSWLAGAVFKALTLAWLAGSIFPLLARALTFG
jgi:pimeloyl-ACP methyl ester carboxylesterase